MRTLFLMILVAFLAACGEVGEDESPVPLVTLSAPPTLEQSGTCEDVRVFEAWLQHMSFQLDEFDRMLASIEGLSRVQLRAELARLDSVRGFAAEVPVPDCAIATGNNAIATMTGILEALAPFANDGEGDFEATVANQRQRFADVDAAMAELIAQMEQAYRQP